VILADTGACEMMGPVEDHVTVWAVDLGRDALLKERRGTLSLDAGALRFEPAAEGQPEVLIALAEIRKVRRLKGSPVLLVVRPWEGGDRITAFYFVQPPPLEAFRRDTPEPRQPGFAGLRSPRRRARKQNVGYLGMSNRQKKAELVAWERAVREAVARARGA
jgi:hypothetical protein